MTTTVATRTPAHGVLDLHFAQDAAGLTVLRRRRHRFPLRMTAPLRLDRERRDMAFVYVQNPTGAVFEGDRLDVSVVVDDGACVHLTVPSATKVHRMEVGEATQDTLLVLGPGAFVESVPEPIIPQAGSRYRQHTEARLGAGARLVLCESVAPGREAMGERFAYDRLELGTRIRDDTGDLLVDVLEIEPGGWAPSRRGLVGRRPFAGTIHAVAPDGDADALAVHLDAALAADERAFAAAGVLPGGVGAFARVLARDAPTLRRAMRAGWAAARQILLGAGLPETRR